MLFHPNADYLRNFCRRTLKSPNVKTAGTFISETSMTYKQANVSTVKRSSMVCWRSMPLIPAVHKDNFTWIESLFLRKLGIMESR